jgi:tetrahydromethanopterin S-methyltransferase subunit G
VGGRITIDIEPVRRSSRWGGYLTGLVVGLVFFVLPALIIVMLTNRP